MKKTIKLLCTWAAGLLLAGCSSEADMSKLMDWQSNPDAVHFTASVNNATTRTNPAATDNTQTIFNNNDKVTVSNNGNQADYAYDGKSWAPAIPDKYLLLDKSNLIYNCWYPASDNNTATVGYLTVDQSTEEDMAKSDYMNAATTLTNISDPLNFSLKRKTARLIIKISDFTGVSGNNTTIKHVRIVSKASTAEGETNTIDITPLTSGGGGIGTTYTALVAPGKIVAKFYFNNDMNEEKPVTMTTNVAAAGNSYIYNLTVVKKTIEITGITVGKWNAGDIAAGDFAEIPCLTFSAEQELTFKMTAYGDYTITGLQYSVTPGEWKDVVSGEEVTFGGGKGFLCLRGKDNLTGTAKSKDNYSKISFNNDVKVSCIGDIRTLLDYENYEKVATDKARFCNLFERCTQLISAPDLPAMTLADYCYYYMFSYCGSLEKAPKLPASELNPYCYEGMFNGCGSLKKAPKLLATKLADGSYKNMFLGCSTLNSVTMLAPSNQITSNSFYNWLYTAGRKAFRTLVLEDKAAYDALKTNRLLPSDWQIGNCTVQKEDGTEITE